MLGGGIEDALRSLLIHLHSDGHDRARTSKVCRDAIQVVARRISLLLVVGARDEGARRVRRYTALTVWCNDSEDDVLGYISGAECEHVVQHGLQASMIANRRTCRVIC